MSEPKSRRQRKTFALAVASEPCCVCGTRDLRALLSVSLASGDVATLCGSHDMMHARDGRRASSIAELRAAYAERRSMDRRAIPYGEADELAERLAAAFTRERRAAERRAS